MELLEMKSLAIDDVVNFMSDNSFSKKILIGYSSPLQDFELQEIGTKTGSEIFEYGGELSVRFDSFTKENEFHFDGISSPNHSRVPSFLLFEFIQCSLDKNSNPIFKLLDCELVLSDLDNHLKSFLATRKIIIKGHGNPAMPEFPADFSFYPIQEVCGRKVLRMHLPSANPGLVEIREDSVYSLNENIEIGIEGLSGCDAYELFQELNKTIERSAALIKFRPEPGLLAVVNNNFCFHGREAPKSVSSRILRRTQYFKRLR